MVWVNGQGQSLFLKAAELLEDAGHLGSMLGISSSREEHQDRRVLWANNEPYQPRTAGF